MSDIFNAPLCTNQQGSDTISMNSTGSSTHCANRQGSDTISMVPMGSKVFDQYSYIRSLTSNIENEYKKIDELIDDRVEIYENIDKSLNSIEKFGDKIMTMLTISNIGEINNDIINNFTNNKRYSISYDRNKLIAQLDNSYNSQTNYRIFSDLYIADLRDIINRGNHIDIFYNYNTIYNLIEEYDDFYNNLSILYKGTVESVYDFEGEFDEDDPDKRSFYKIEMYLYNIPLTITFEISGYTMDDPEFDVKYDNEYIIYEDIKFPYYTKLRDTFIENYKSKMNIELYGSRYKKIKDIMNLHKITTISVENFCENMNKLLKHIILQFMDDVKIWD